MIDYDYCEQMAMAEAMPIIAKAVELALRWTTSKTTRRCSSCPTSAWMRWVLGLNH